MSRLFEAELVEWDVPPEGHVWRAAAAERQGMGAAQARALKRHLALHGDVLRQSYRRPSLLRERRAVPEGLVLGYLAGIVTGASLAFLALRVAGEVVR